MKFPNVSSTSVKLILFPFSLEGAARIWLDKEPPRSILTWDDLVSKFINKFFPPLKMTNLRNEITRFQQRFNESFYEAWDRFNDLNHDLCVLDFIKDVNAHDKSKSVKKSSKRKVWKPTGKVFTNIGYTWRSIGRTFTIVGNACPLTRITTTAEVPLRKPTTLESDTLSLPVTFGFSGKPRKSQIKCSRHPNCSLIGSVMISKVYYVEGLGHNLFSVGQFCDSNLKVAFCQLTCFIRNLEVCGAPKRRFREYTPPVTKNANSTDVRKARKAELQRDEAVGKALPIAVAVGAVALAALYFYLNNSF
ncbi:integrase, catalytic region, zinc finger, CCHC-type containing protein [Tanacetum coccineum]